MAKVIEYNHPIAGLQHFPQGDCKTQVDVSIYWGSDYKLVDEPTEAHIINGKVDSIDKKDFRQTSLVSSDEMVWNTGNGVLSWVE